MKLTEIKKLGAPDRQGEVDLWGPKHETTIKHVAQLLQQAGYSTDPPRHLLYGIALHFDGGLLVFEKPHGTRVNGAVLYPYADHGRAAWNRLTGQSFYDSNPLTVEEILQAVKEHVPR